MLDIFQFSFLTRALLAGLAAGLICPSIGVFLVLRRFSLIADTLSHVALAGVALGLLLGIYPGATALVAAVAAALAIEWLRAERNIYGEATLALFLSGGLALALVFLGMGRGINADLFSYLFGSILAVSTSDLALVSALGLAVAATLALFYRELFAIAFDEEAAKVSGIPVRSLNLLLVALTALAVTIGMQTVGVLLVGALMVIPVLTAMQLSRSFRGVLLASMALGVLAVLIGLALSYAFNLPPGGAIVLASLSFFVASMVVGRR